MTNFQKNPNETHRELVPLLTMNQRKIFAYLYTLVPNRSDAEELLQETCVTLFEKFDEFEPGTDFVAWANRVAWWKVRESRQKYARSKMVFSDEVMEAITETVVQLEPELNQRHDALQHCLKKLNDRDRMMVLTRYEKGNGVVEAAKQVGRSVQAAYKSLTRLRTMLGDCVSDRLEQTI